ncbi:ATP-binding protein [Chloroflexota bacterium]
MSQETKGGKLRWLRRLMDSAKEPEDEQARQLAEMEERLALANALSQIVISSSDLRERCELFANEIKGLLSVDWATIALIDRSTELVRLTPFSSKIVGDWEMEESLPLEGTPVAWVAENQRAMLEPDLRGESQFRTGAALLKMGVRTMIYMPLFAGGEVFGSVMLGSKQPKAYGERELKLLKYATTQLATVIENSRLFKEIRERGGVQADFITALAHELKTPLTPIKASSELLAEELQEGEVTSQSRLVESIAQGAHTLDRRLSMMLDLAKMQSDGFKLELEGLDIRPMLEKMVSRCGKDVEAKNQSVTLDVPDALPSVKANKGELERVLTILLTNATKFSPDGGAINVQAEKRGHELVVEVQDSGGGFSPQELEKLFDAYDPEADRQRIPEMRLGLALSKRLMELQGGRLWVRNNAGQGSTFAISLRQA